MNQLILNGIPEDAIYQDMEVAIEIALKEQTKTVIDYFKLRDMTINYCTGCWSCWYKTPGQCAFKDDHEQILSRLPHTDKLLFITPVIMGYESALIKTCKDRNIPIAHPYIEIHHGEMHHRQRYSKTTEIQVLLITDSSTTQEDIDLVKMTYERMALNFHSRVTYFETIDSIGGVNDAINNL